MRQVKLTKTNEGVKFWLQNNDDLPHFIRGEFALKEQGYKAYKYGDRSKEKIFPKGKKVWGEILRKLRYLDIKRSKVFYNMKHF